MDNIYHWLGSLATLVYKPRQVRKKAAVVNDVCAEMYAKPVLNSNYNRKNASW